MAEGVRSSVLVIGGSGVFGSRLAEGLVRDKSCDVVIAGRSPGPLDALARSLGATALALDRDAPDLAETIASVAPFAVIDAAGPFQSYGASDPYRIARAALQAGAHYIDLSDDAFFVAGIASLQDEAASRGLVAISGASSVPAISAAAVRALSGDLARIDLVASAILPGNRAPRGRSVMAAILAQAGKPLPGGELGWIGTSRLRGEAEGDTFTRLASPIGAPDLVLFQSRFETGDVRFRAGLELPVLHRGFGMIAHLVRLRVLRSAEPLLSVLHPIARLFEPFGSDKGAMCVLVRGETGPEDLSDRCWTLVASAGTGPHVPAIAARILVRKLRDGEIDPGARPCLDDVTLEEVEAAAPELGLKFQRQKRVFLPLFAQVLGPDHARLPAPIRALHTVAGTRVWRGSALVERGTSPLSRLVGRVFRFPPESDTVPVTVTMRRDNGSETWTRDFGGARFRSRLSADPQRGGRVWERFGPFSFAIDLKADGETLSYPISAGRCLGLPLPWFALPRSDTRESVDDQGRATFNVCISLPLAGLVVRYRGWLLADQPIKGDQDDSTVS